MIKMAVNKPYVIITYNEALKALHKGKTVATVDDAGNINWYRKYNEFGMLSISPDNLVWAQAWAGLSNKENYIIIE